MSQDPLRPPSTQIHCVLLLIVTTLDLQLTLLFDFFFGYLPLHKRFPFLISFKGLDYFFSM